jgi:hypothetical protein
VVAWDVEVSNQDGELVASYDILTLVAKRRRREPCAWMTVDDSASMPGIRSER